MANNERNNVMKIKDLADRFPEVFTMEYDGTKSINTPYGASFLFTYSDSKGNKYSTFLKGTEFSSVYEKKLLDVVNTFKKGQSFTVRRFEKESKKTPGRAYSVYAFTNPDDKSVTDTALRRMISYAIDNNMTVDDLERFAIKSGATNEEVSWLKTEFLRKDGGAA